MYNNITTFIHNLFGTDEFVPLHAPLFIGNEKKYLAECIDTTFVSSVGKFVDRFEELVACYTGCLLYTSVIASCLHWIVGYPIAHHAAVFYAECIPHLPEL